MNGLNTNDPQGIILFYLKRIKYIFPGTIIVCSNFLQRRVWRGVRKPAYIEQATVKVHKVIHTVVLDRGGECLLHDSIKHDMPHLYTADGVLLSTDWCKAFLPGSMPVGLYSQ